MKDGSKLAKLVRKLIWNHFDMSINSKLNKGKTSLIEITRETFGEISNIFDAMTTNSIEIKTKFEQYLQESKECITNSTTVKNSKLCQKKSIA